MSKLCVVFEVLDEEGNQVLVKSQVALEVSTAELCQESAIEQLTRVIREVENGANADLLRDMPQRDFPGEQTEAVGHTIGKYLDLKLRHWARSKVNGQG